MYAEIIIDRWIEGLKISTANEINLKVMSLTNRRKFRKKPDTGLSGRVAVRQPCLRKRNTAKRLRYAKSYKSWTENLSIIKERHIVTLSRQRGKQSAANI